MCCQDMLKAEVSATCVLAAGTQFLVWMAAVIAAAPAAAT